MKEAEQYQQDAACVAKIAEPVWEEAAHRAEAMMTDEAKQSIQRVLLHRINQAREAVGDEPLTELHKGKPGSCFRCQIGANLGVETYREHIYVKDADEAEQIADAWETSVTPLEWAPSKWHYRVTIPADLQNAALLFDVELLPELVGEFGYGSAEQLRH